MLLVVLFYSGHLAFSLSFSYNISYILSQSYGICQMTMSVFPLEFWPLGSNFSKQGRVY